MDTETAWALFIAGFTDTVFARRAETRFRAGPLEAVHFAEGGPCASLSFLRPHLARVCQVRRRQAGQRVR